MYINNSPLRFVEMDLERQYEHESITFLESRVLTVYVFWMIILAFHWIGIITAPNYQRHLLLHLPYLAGVLLSLLGIVANDWIRLG